MTTQGSSDLPNEATMEKIAKAIGCIAIYYAWIEDRLDGIVAAVHMKVPSGNELRKRYPFTSSNELEFLEKAFKELPALGRYRDAANAVVAQLEKPTCIRNAVIHGYIKSFDKASSTLEFSRVVVEQNKPRHRVMTIKLPVLLQTSAELWRIRGRADDLYNELRKAFG